jgi:hypothetical protein
VNCQPALPRKVRVWEACAQSADANARMQAPIHVQRIESGNRCFKH